MNVGLGLIITIVQSAIALAPELWRELREIFNRSEPPTAADWDALRARLKTYDIDEAGGGAGGGETKAK